MKVLIVITKAELGGAQRFVIDLAHYLQDHGHAVSVAYGEPGFLTDLLAKRQIPIFSFKTLKRSFNPFRSWGFVRELKKFLTNHAFDIVHCNSSNTFLGIFGIRSLPNPPKTIATLHGLSLVAPEHQSLFKPLYSWLFSFLLKRFNEVVYISERDQHNAISSQLPKGTVIALGISEQNYLAREPAREVLCSFDRRIIRDHFLLAVVGRLAYPKNQLFLINHYPTIARIIPNAQLLLIGDGPDRPMLKKIISEKKLEKHILLLGSIPEAQNYFKGFDLLLIPSTYEGVPYVALEAIQARIPLLAAAVGGLPQVLPPALLFSLNEASFTERLMNLQALRFPPPPLLAERTLAHMGESYLKLYQKAEESRL